MGYKLDQRFITNQELVLALMHYKKKIEIWDENFASKTGIRFEMKILIFETEFKMKFSISNFFSKNNMDGGQTKLNLHLNVLFKIWTYNLVVTLNMSYHYFHWALLLDCANWYTCSLTSKKEIKDEIWEKNISSLILVAKSIANFYSLFFKKIRQRNILSLNLFQIQSPIFF